MRENFPTQTVQIFLMQCRKAIPEARTGLPLGLWQSCDCVSRRLPLAILHGAAWGGGVRAVCPRAGNPGSLRAPQVPGSSDMRGRKTGHLRQEIKKTCAGEGPVAETSLSVLTCQIIGLHMPYRCHKLSGCQPPSTQCDSGTHVLLCHILHCGHSNLLLGT